MTEQLKNILIGFFIIAATSLLIWMLLFLHPSLGDGDQTMTVRFSNISQIGLGTRVTFAGKPVGQVTAIHLVPNARTDGIVDQQGDPYIFQLTLAIDSHVKVYNTDKIVIQTTGLLGEKSITIVPEVPPKGIPTHLVKSSEILYAQSYGPIESTVFQLEKVGTKVSTALDSVIALLDANSSNITGTITNMNTTFANLSDILDEAKQQQIVAETSRVLENLGNITDNINPTDVNNIVHNASTFSDALANSSEDFQATVQNTRELTYEGKNTLANLSQITDTIAQGKGSIGKLIESDDFYLKVMAMMSKVNTLMNDVNHYGILFHLNKGWQRERQQKMHELSQLNSPRDFSNYLNRELDGISTALARINLLLDKASNSGEKERILHSDAFKKDYLNLMQQIDHLDDVLKSYNEKMQEAN